VERQGGNGRKGKREKSRESSSGHDRHGKIYHTKRVKEIIPWSITEEFAVGSRSVLFKRNWKGEGKPSEGEVSRWNGTDNFINVELGKKSSHKSGKTKNCDLQNSHWGNT